MTRLQELSQQFKIAQSKLHELVEAYRDKQKGELYHKAYKLNVAKMQDLQKKYMEYGSGYTIITIKGIRKRPSKRTPSIMVNENFELQLVNVSVEDIPEWLANRFKNIISYSLEKTESGILISK